MHALLMALTISSCVLGNSIKNNFAKSRLKNQSDNLIFNLAGNVLCIAVMICFGGLGRIHAQTVLLGMLFGILNLISGVTYTLGLKHGPMSLSALIILGGSMIVSTVMGMLCFSESASILQIGGIVIMLICMVLVSDTKVDTNITASWLIIVAVSGFFNGLLGIVQKLQGNSLYPEEKMEFLLWTFIFCSIFNVIWLLINSKTGKKEPVTIKLKGLLLVSALIVGLTTAAQHIINLKLVTEMPAAVFFPICSGGRILISTLVDIVIFRERLSVRQVISFVLGFAAIMIIALG